MELRPLTLDAHLEDARQNLITTYRGLASVLPDIALVPNEHFVRVKSHRPYSFCNMCVGFHCAEHEIAQVALEVRALCEASPHFRAFSLTGDPPAFRGALEAAGLSSVHRLEWLLADPILKPCERPAPVLATEMEERSLVADFIVEGFFEKHPRQFKSAVHETTAKSSFELLYWGRIERPSAACMLVHTSGCLGIFNVIVATRERNQGWGSDVIHYCAALAGQKRLKMSVQCDASLVAWYRKFGFVQVGNVESFAKIA